MTPACPVEATAPPIAATVPCEDSELPMIVTVSSV
jgi:hypothetical protein